MSWGPSTHIDQRISHSGLKARYKGGGQKSRLEGSFSCDLLGLQCQREVWVGSVRRGEAMQGLSVGYKEVF